MEPEKNVYLEDMQKLFNSEYEKNTRIQNVLLKLKEGASKLSYEDADIYAVEVAGIREKVLRRYAVKLDPAEYPTIADLAFEPQLKEDYFSIIEFCKEVQERLNKTANIGISFAYPKFNQDMADGLKEKIKISKTPAEFSDAIVGNLKTFNKTVVGDCVKVNAKKHYKYGLSPKIKRIVQANACQWCKARAGIMEYADVARGDEIFRFHKDCTCRIVYDPMDGSKLISTKTQKPE